MNCLMQVLTELRLLLRCLFFFFSLGQKRESDGNESARKRLNREPRKVQQKKPLISETEESDELQVSWTRDDARKVNGQLLYRIFSHVLQNFNSFNHREDILASTISHAKLLYFQR